MAGFNKKRLKRLTPGPVLSAYHFVRDGDVRHAASFLRPGGETAFRAGRWALLRRLYAISQGMDCPHTQQEMMEIIGRLLALPPSLAGSIVEAGCFRGGSTAKLSLAARRTGRKLVVFDSFQGLPEHGDPEAENIFGETVRFAPGDYRAGLEEVRKNVARWGAPEVCEFRPGWFKDAMPGFREPVALAFLDVDLAESTRTALKHIYPLLAPGGSLFSHDGHLAPVIAVFRDQAFWEREVGVPCPAIEGLGRRKLIRLDKPA
jgi:O-methyltransferase